jgi:hypothetical protein
MKKRPDRGTQLTAVARESDKNLRELIRRWQALPPSAPDELPAASSGVSRDRAVNAEP